MVRWRHCLRLRAMGIGYWVLGAAGGYPRHSTDWNALVIAGGIVKRWGYGEVMPPRILAMLRRQPLGPTFELTGILRWAGFGLGFFSPNLDCRKMSG